MPAHNLQDAIRRVRRRIVVDRTLRLTGLCLSGTLLLAALLLLVDRAWSLNLPLGMYIALPAVGFVLGLARALWRVPAALDIAVHLDRELNLQDQLGSAIAAKDLPPVRREPAFSAILSRAADQLAGRIDIRAASPVRITRIWLVAILLGGLFGTGLPLLPDNWIGRADAATQLAQQRAEEQQQQRRELAASLDDTLEDLRTNEDLLDAQTQQDLQALEQLAAQLAGEDADAADIDPLQAQAEATKKLTEVADRLQQQAQRDQAAADELVQRFRRLPGPDGADAPRITDDLTDALRKGDLPRAADALDSAVEQAKRLPPEQRDQVIDDLRELADRIDNAADAANPHTDAQWDQLRDALRDQGLDEQAIDDLLSQAGAPPREESDAPPTTDDQPASPAPDEDVAAEDPPAPDDASTPPQDDAHPPADEDASSSDAPSSDQSEPAQDGEPADDQTQRARDDSKPAPSADDIQRELEKQGVDEDTARRIAEDVERQQQQQQAEDKAEQDAERIADTVEKAADELQNPPQDTPQPPADADSPDAPTQQPTDQPQSDPHAPDAQPKPHTDPSQQPDPNQPSDSSPTQQPTKQPTEQPTGTPRPDPSGPPKPDSVQPPQQPGTPPQGDPTQPPPQGDPPQGDPTQPPPQGDPSSTPQDPTGQPTGQPTGPPQPGEQPQGPPTGPPQPGQPQPDGTPQGHPTPGQPDGTPQNPTGAPTPSSTGRSDPRPGDGIRDVFRGNGDDERLRDTIQRTRDGANDLGQDPPDDQQDRWRSSPRNPMDPDRPQDMSPVAGNGAGDTTLDPNDQGSTAPQTDDVDIRGDEPNDQTIAEWFDPNTTPRPDGSITQAGPDAQQRVRQARQVAERAVDNSAVPRRYHDLIRAYFNRIQKLAEQTETPGEAPAAP
jgi:hypothetical protein